MDDTKEGLLLIGTTMIVLLAFLVTVLAVMAIYRKRKLQHTREISDMNERFGRELLQTQVEVQQQTMKQIGWEIHDNVGQKLTLAVLYAEQLDLGDPGAAQKISSIASIIHESLGDLRSSKTSFTPCSATSVPGSGPWVSTKWTSRPIPARYPPPPP
jgi:signal transduction histidine kinase